MPSELSEQVNLARELDRAHICWFHVPNGGSRKGREAVSLRLSGVKAGIPDVLIVDRPPSYPSLPGVALELKSLKGHTSPEQEHWLRAFASRGWATIVAYGYEDAIAQLRVLGYRL